jgi:hypothetical protein
MRKPIPRQTGCKEHIVGIVDAKRRRIGKRSRQAPTTQVRARTHIGGLCPWRRATAHFTFNDRGPDSARAELDREGQPDRTSADD